MLSAPESPKTAAVRGVPASGFRRNVDGTSDGSPSIICDLAEGNAFTETYGKPHIPVMSAFGAGHLHACRLNGSWDLEGMASGYASALFRSIRKLVSKDDKETTKAWDDLTFRFGPRAFLYADENRIIGFAATAAEAERLVAECSGRYWKETPESACGGEFHLIQHEGDNIRAKSVPLAANTILEGNAFDLHYGDGAGAWHEGFVHRFCGRPSGLTIFEENPGTAKTFYLRHLMGVLRETHRFYFIPTLSMEILSRPAFVGFWADERREHPEGHFVVILEDATSAPCCRSTSWYRRSVGSGHSAR